VDGKMRASNYQFEKESEVHSKYGHPEDDYSANLKRVDPYLNDDGSVGGGGFVITFHKGCMPAFDSNPFATLAKAKAWAKSQLGITHWRDASGQFTAESMQ
jgi:hypothetical protein